VWNTIIQVKLDKTTDVYELKRQAGGLFTVDTESRNKPIGRFSFSIDSDGMSVNEKVINK
jgi:hypothetical protein